MILTPSVRPLNKYMRVLKMSVAFRLAITSNSFNSCLSNFGLLVYGKMT